MRIIVDAFGGDNAPLEIIKGSARAAAELSVEIALTGDKSAIEKVMSDNNIPSKGIEIIHASEVVTMDDDPASAVRKKRDSSMMKGLSVLAEGGGDAFVSAGSTGALLAGATFIVKRLEGVKRAALAPIIPCRGGRFMLIDCGANAECKPEYLSQFARMGAAYMRGVFGVQNPRVGLCNIGVEEKKGTELYQESYELLKRECSEFIGNVETRQLPLGDVDVAVCDGFTGNIILKTIEGTAKFMLLEVKSAMLKNTVSKMGALLLKPAFKSLKDKLDPGKIGGTPFLGIRKPVVKSHGNSDAAAIFASIKNAKEFADSNAIELLEKSL